MATIPYYLVGGGFQDSAGNVIANGRLTATLSRPATDLTGTIQICNDFECSYALDENGNLSASPNLQRIWPNDQMLPGSLFYMLTVFTEEGETAWGPNATILDSSESEFVQTTSFVGDGVTTTFVLTGAPIENSVSVSVNGIEQGGNFSVSGDTVTLSFTPAVLDEIDIFYYTDSLVSPVFRQEVPAGSGTSFALSSTPATNSLLLYRAQVGSGGLLLIPGVDFTTSGRAITLASPVGAGYSLWAEYATTNFLSNFTTPEQAQPEGPLNSSNKTFTLSQPAVPASLRLFWNSQRLTSGVDYILASDNQTITMTEAPASGDSLWAAYNLFAVVINVSNFAPANPA